MVPTGVFDVLGTFLFLLLRAGVRGNISRAHRASVEANAFKKGGAEERGKFKADFTVFTSETQVRIVLLKVGRV